MDVGLTMFATDQAMSPARLAREAEDRGFESLFFPEHTHIPVSRLTPYPVGGELPEEYKRTLDPFVGLAAAATVTERLRIGTGICLVAQRDPIVLAKEVASLDLVSEGRFIFGVGYGWNADELQSHGVAPSERRDVVRERVLAMKEIWAHDVAAFDSPHVSIPPNWSWPKPVQKPNPPVIIGGAAGPTLFRHVAEFADGWMPIGGSGLARHWSELRRLAELAGRDPESLEVDITYVRPDPGVLSHYASMGVRRVVLGLPAAAPDVVLPLMDHYAELMVGVS